MRAAKDSGIMASAMPNTSPETPSYDHADVEIEGLGRQRQVFGQA